MNRILGALLWCWDKLVFGVGLIALFWGSAIVVGCWLKIVLQVAGVLR